MTSISLQEAQQRLPELIGSLGPGDELLITQDNLPIARLVGEASLPKRPTRQLGTLAGTVLHIDPDFDAPLDDFREDVCERPACP
jgi:antitoxin (DNA-binding transcriptional repressor) of toxin-antitoxin stability system